MSANMNNSAIPAAFNIDATEMDPKNLFRYALVQMRAWKDMVISLKKRYSLIELDNGEIGTIPTTNQLKNWVYNFVMNLDEQVVYTTEVKTIIDKMLEEHELLNFDTENLVDKASEYAEVIMNSRKYMIERNKLVEKEKPKAAPKKTAAKKKVVAEKTVEKTVVDKTVVEETVVEKTVVEETVVDKTVAEKTVEDVVAEKTVEDVVAEKTVAEEVAEKTVAEEVAEKTVEEVVAAEEPKVAKKRVVKKKVAEEVAEKTGEDTVTEEPKVAKKRVVKKKVAEEVAEEVAEKKTDEQAPQEVAEEKSETGTDAPERKKRGPSAYNIFIKDEINRLRVENPEINHKVAMAMAVAAWKKNSPTRVANETPIVETTLDNTLTA